MSVKSLLVTGADDEQNAFVHLALIPFANDVSQRGKTVHWKVYAEDWDKALSVCQRLDATAQTIVDVPCEIYPVVHQGRALAVPPCSRWCFHWMKILPGVPLVAWVNDDRTMTYKGQPFNGRECMWQPSEAAEWQWLEIGDVASFPDAKVFYFLGAGGTLTRFDTEAEAEAYALANPT